MKFRRTIREINAVARRGDAGTLCAAVAFIIIMLRVVELTATMRDRGRNATKKPHDTYMYRSPGAQKKKSCCSRAAGAAAGSLRSKTSMLKVSWISQVRPTEESW